MQRITHSLKQLWRSERILRKHELRISVLKVLYISFAALIVLFSLFMLDLAGFFALAPRIGRPLAALSVTGINLVIAGLLIAYARSLKPPPELEMVKQVRDMAMDDLEEEVALAGDEVKALRNDIHSFIRHPVDALLPAIGPLIAAVVRGIESKKSTPPPETDDAGKDEAKA